MAHTDGFSTLTGLTQQNAAVSFFFLIWQLAPAGLHSDLVKVDEEWQRLNLLTGSRRSSPETQTQIQAWLRQGQHSTPIVHSLQTVQDWQMLLCLPMADQAQPQQPADAGQRQKKKHMDWDFQKTGQWEHDEHCENDIEDSICRELKIVNDSAGLLSTLLSHALSSQARQYYTQ